jgi:hypothetical protein
VPLILDEAVPLILDEAVLPVRTEAVPQGRAEVARRVVVVDRSADREVILVAVPAMTGGVGSAVGARADSLRGVVMVTARSGRMPVPTNPTCRKMSRPVNLIRLSGVTC